MVSEFPAKRLPLPDGIEVTLFECVSWVALGKASTVEEHEQKLARWLHEDGENARYFMDKLSPKFDKTGLDQNPAILYFDLLPFLNEMDEETAAKHKMLRAEGEKRHKERVLLEKAEAEVFQLAKLGQLAVRGRPDKRSHYWKELDPTYFRHPVRMNKRDGHLEFDILNNVVTFVDGPDPRGLFYLNPLVRVSDLRRAFPQQQQSLGPMRASARSWVSRQDQSLGARWLKRDLKRHLKNDFPESSENRRETAAREIVREHPDRFKRGRPKKMKSEGE